VLTALDHVALVVHDLEAAVAQYQSLLGKVPNWRGADGGAAHAWFQLGNTALDIIAPIGAGYTGDRVKTHLEHQGEGIWALAFATPDIEKTRRTLARRAVPSTDARPIRSTHVETGQARYWTTSVLDAQGTHGPTIFLIEQKADATPWPLSACSVEESTDVSGLDHAVVRTTHPNRATAFYGARLGLDMALDRTNPQWNARLMFFRCADLIIEVAYDLRQEAGDDPDTFWGLSWRTPDIDCMQSRLAAAGFNVSGIRTGRKPGTRVFTVRDGTCGVPTLIIGRDEQRGAE
jgi:catechol 2,3-dioxygenase-like lactoylglutathione lyase family enzyme